MKQLIALTLIALVAGCATGSKKDQSDALSRELYKIICTEGNEKQVAELVKKGANVNYVQNSLSLLISAIYCKASMDKIKLIVEAGANINAGNHVDESVLMYAVDSDRPDLVKYLLEKGVNINHRNAFGANALSWAQNRTNKRQIDMLLRNAGLSNMGYGFVKAKSGIWLREQPTRKSANFLLVPFNERVDFLMTMPNSRETIDGLNNFWYQVRYKNKEGYVFGGYLTRDPN